MYKGDYKNNQFDGQGCYYFSNNDRVEGVHVNGFREGLCTYYWAGGAKWTGNFCANKFHGEGQYNTGTSEWTVTYNMGKEVRK